MNFSTKQRQKGKGIFHGSILMGYHDPNFEAKYEDYLRRSGAERCLWISKTDYNTYYKILYDFVSKIRSDKQTLYFMSEFTKRKLYSTTQHLAKIYTMGKFFQDKAIDEALIDEHIDIFRDLGAILETHLN